MNLNELKNIYFIGIGGIGMSALARYFLAKGCIVSGYDRSPSPLISELIREGMDIHFEDNPELLPSLIDLVVYTPAIPKYHRELNWLTDHGYTIMKRSQVLGIIASEHQSIAVAGTHGKTSITSMIAHILKYNNYDITAFIGGISNNLKSNICISSPTRYVIVEADEYDRSFLALSPDLAVISAMDPDHLDVYNSHENMVDSYNEFAARVRPGGVLVHRSDLPLQTLNEVERITYSLSENADCYAENIRSSQGYTTFDLHFGEVVTQGIEVRALGQFNIENMLAAFAICHSMGVETNHIVEALATYQGVQRRFDYRIQRHDLVYIDDYAHHPQEIAAVIESVRMLYPGKKITGVFQPHLYSRTRDFMEAFARSLEALDELFLLEIYPAREEPIEGISSGELLQKVHLKNKQLTSGEELLKILRERRPEVLLTLGAGDIDRMVAPIEEIFNETYARS